MKYNKLIDHTILKPDASIEAIKKICQEAKEYDFMSVCVNPAYISLCKEELKGSDVKVCTVIGFPLGATLPQVKALETREAVMEGADEIDMVINVTMLKAKNDDYVYQEIEKVRRSCVGKVLKVIIETCLLTDEEKVRACLLAKKAGADFVKTSTGFSTGGATVHDVALMRKTVGDDMGVKASGGVRTHEDLLAMVEAGANRIGTSAGPKII
ncbi:MAG: deoxyribose-phosphate aldolase [Erysipelotrichaceae bacterium]|nr:deoxyribose-phosphate aldolase [Erysipelotrichaceae bacterium]